MGRELKFRQWVKGKFYYWGIGIEGNTFVGPASGGGVRIDNSPHQQFTGLKDRNGAEVWEGDVIRWANAPSIHFRWRVDYSENEAMFFATSLDGYSGGSLQGIAAQGGIEVIGNVFQHPHLLERP